MSVENLALLLTEFEGSDMEIEADNCHAFMEAMKNFAGGYDWSKPCKVKITVPRGRTLTQNAALHKYLTDLSEALNAAGYDQRKVMKPEAEIPWNDVSAKENLWRPIQKAMLGFDSTKEMNTKQVSEVYQVLDRHLASKVGVSVPFPSIESLMEASRGE